ncbi:unnamed protein product [Nyctereutes procyonoides]|uniref:(raccoon dog) hypothetical protein n=1 Tax=Nyctereutes procyonoides TaxID=34880 RepID=A0A811ZTG7_NYCPR|nr:unnamed protein product [Nyctereutes procyonoides]
MESHVGLPHVAAAAELGGRREEAAGGDRHVLVAEVTQPSLGVGYEQDQAVALNKRILCLFRPQSGRTAQGSRCWDYEEGQVEAMLDQYFGADPP